MAIKPIVVLLVGLALASVRLAGAQQPKKVPLVGILTPDPVSARINLFEAFKKGLREVGYVEGQNIGIEVRSAEGKRDIDHASDPSGKTSDHHDPHCGDQHRSSWVRIGR